MKLIIPDIHGRRFWRKVRTSKADRIVLLGDYLDSFTISPENQLNNLIEIIQFKKDNMDRVILLWGNHDTQYLHIDKMEYRCSGFSEQFATAFYAILWDHKYLFQHLYYENEILYVHAGLQNSLYNDLDQKYGPFTDMQDFVDFVNRYEPKEIFNISKLNGGFDEYAGLHWTRPIELERNGYEVKQVVGHTFQKSRQIRYINGLYAVCDIAKVINIKDLTF